MIFVYLFFFSPAICNADSLSEFWPYNELQNMVNWSSFIPGWEFSEILRPKKQMQVHISFE